MEYVTVGDTGVKVSPLCMGTMSFGGDADEATAGQMYRRCREAGINFFDSADTYQEGTAERILGKLMKSEREELVISTKLGFKGGPGLLESGLSRRHLVRGVEAQLKRLGTDWIDFLLVHTFDPLVEIADVMRSLDQLVRSGKVLYVGVSNWAAWQIATALGVSARELLTRFRIVEPMYSLVRRQVEVEILPLAKAAGLGVIPYSPLGGGLLTGKYQAGQGGAAADGASHRTGTGRLTSNERYAARYGFASDDAAAAGLVGVAREMGVQPAALAVAWVMANPAVTAPIIGARNVGQLEGSLGALDVAMTPDLYARLCALTPTPHPATDRTELINGVSDQL